MLALLDLDSPVYRVGFTTEEEDVEIAYARMDDLLFGILDDLKCDNYVGYLSPTDGNFRNNIATIKPYKGNRKQPKPKWYNELRTYLKDKWFAHIPVSIEADDALGIQQYFWWKRNIDASIIVTIDKDLNQIPGWHYNFVKKEKYYVSPEEAEDFFYTQLLTGDATDNIQGVPGIGPAKASKILKGAETEAQKYNRCLNAYYNHYKNYHEDEVENILLENARLLYILREEDKDFEIPKVESGTTS